MKAKWIYRVVDGVGKNDNLTSLFIRKLWQLVALALLSNDNCCPLYWSPYEPPLIFNVAGVKQNNIIKIKTCLHDNDLNTIRFKTYQLS